VSNHLSDLAIKDKLFPIDPGLTGFQNKSRRSAANASANSFGYNSESCLPSTSASDCRLRNAPRLNSRISLAAGNVLHIDRLRNVINERTQENSFLAKCVLKLRALGNVPLLRPMRRATFPVR
jgi:hypothetical protein